MLLKKYLRNWGRSIKSLFMRENVMLKLPKVIVFDWDSTLAQTRQTVVAALEQTLKYYNMPPWKQTKKLRKPMLSLKDNFPLIFGEKSDEAYAYYLSVYQAELTHPSVGAERFLALCKRLNIGCYIVSNKEKALLMREVKQCFSGFAFDKILGYGDAPKNKPSAEPVFFALKDIKIDINPYNVWLVGDSLPDAECASQAHVQAIIIGHNINDQAYLEQKMSSEPPLIMVESFDDITQMVEELK